MTRMPRLALFLAAAFLCAAHVRGGEKLSLDDALDLNGKVRPRAARPVAWLDDGHYLAVDAVDPGAGADADDDARAPSPRRLYRIDAATGERAEFLDAAAMEEALARVPGIDPARAKKIAARTSFTFSDDFDGILLQEFDDLWYYSRAAKEARRLTSDPEEEVGEAFAPDGRWVAYLRGSDLHVVSTRGGAPRALTRGGGENLLRGRLDWVYQEEVYGRGNWQGYWWSPDSRRIAFLELDESPVPEYTIVDHRKDQPDVEHWRYPKAGMANPVARVAVVDVAGGEPRYLDLSRYAGEEFLVVRIGWTPDAAQVVLQIQNRVQTWLDVVVADPVTGRTNVLFRDSTPVWIEPTDAPFWTADGTQFLWLSERDSWRHLYLYSRDGTLVRRLTEGPWEVDAVHRVTADGRVLFTADRDDSRGAKLFSVPLAGGAPQCLTPEPGTHSVDVSPGGTYVADSFSALNDPGRVALLRGDGSTVRVLGAGTLDPLARFDLAPAEFARLKTRDDVPLEAILIKPKDFDSARRYPVLFSIYAGPHAPQVRDSFGGRSYFWHQMLAQEGYVVCVCDNRSASGKGLASVAGVYKDLGASELRDLEDAVDDLVEAGIADPARVGIWGWSYGGYMSAFALTHSKKFAMGIVGAPVTDWRLYDSIYTERYMDRPQNNPDGYDRSSVLTAAKNLEGRMLLMHGTIDENVHIQNSFRFIEALQRAGKSFEFMVFPGNRHGVGDPAQRRFQYQLMTDFVRRAL